MLPRPTRKNSAQATKRKHASPPMQPPVAPKKWHQNVEQQTDDPTQCSGEEFDLQGANCQESDNNEPSCHEVDNRNLVSPGEMPSPSALPLPAAVLSHKLGSSREAKDISHFFERGDKKTGNKTICIFCWCILDELEIKHPADPLGRGVDISWPTHSEG